MKIFSRLFDLNKREVDKLAKDIEAINSFGKKFEKLKEADFAKKTIEFKKRINSGEQLSSVAPEAMALVREASWRAIGLKHYDVQLMAALALAKGAIVEQKTGEGKTLSAIPALYLHALKGKGSHLVTVNDYLARRDAGWNAPTFGLLGLSVGVIAQELKSYVFDSKFSDTSHGDERLEHLKPVERREAYKADVTYGTNNEFGFDYLRDNMVASLAEMVQREHTFAIVDEVDSVLIDEARTPLIISAPDMQPTNKYYTFSQLVEKLSDSDFTIDEKARAASLTEHGIAKMEKLLNVDNLYEKDFESIHHMENALRAKTLYLKDQQYVVKDGQVVIVDEFTGRLMPGRRWSDGLHQAVEAKEGVTIQQESKTMATISFQNYFRMYDTLSGMTGTAVTEADEFKKIYKLDVIAIPTHNPMLRKDHGDSIYKSTSAKYEALAVEVEELHKAGRPVLVGTTSIEKNEIISDLLKRKKIPHNMLNAKNHEREAMIIADAGKLGAVTVATNMAGRGVDIILGGAPPDRKAGATSEKHRESKDFKKWESDHEKVKAAGGLHVIGTERHESRRIDNQLRGRAGRQGDPGSTKFFLSLEDDLMRIFGGEQIASLMNRLRIPEDQPIENVLVSRAIASAQSKVEGFHFDARKRLVEFDDVANQQRDIIYKLRRRILESEDLKREVVEKLEQYIEKIVLMSWPVDEARPDYDRIVFGLLEIVPFDESGRSNIKSQLESVDDKEKLSMILVQILHDAYSAREKTAGVKTMRQIEKYAYLGSIDHLWIDHIDHIDSLREGVSLRAIGQRDPLVEFKGEAYSLFESLIDRIDEELSRRIFRMGISQTPQSEIPLNLIQTNEDLSDSTGLSSKGDQKQKNGKKNTLGRNDPCWCGSGKKWKKCHWPAQR